MFWFFRLLYVCLSVLFEYVCLTVEIWLYDSILSQTIAGRQICTWNINSFLVWHAALLFKSFWFNYFLKVEIIVVCQPKYQPSELIAEKVSVLMYIMRETFPTAHMRHTADSNNEQHDLVTSSAFQLFAVCVYAHTHTDICGFMFISSHSHSWGVGGGRGI